MYSTKIKLYKTLGILILLVVTSMSLQSQVTIGLGTAPEKGALLQLKDREVPGDSVTATTGGLLLPRVILTQKRMLYPMFLDSTQNPPGPTQEYEGNKALLDRSHTGLVVYNLTEDEEEDLCLGLNYWDGTQWNCLVSAAIYAVFGPVNCDSIVFRGEYVEGTAVGADNYMEVTLNVRQTGIFTISAVSNNGYDFYLTGAALHTGPMTIRVPCTGTPAQEGTDRITVDGISLAEGCIPEITVSPPAAVFALNCSTIMVNGQYVKGQSLAAENTITLNVVVSTPGSYNISVSQEQGISFYASGVFDDNDVGTYSVTLSGAGAPTVNTDFPVTIVASTPSGSNICSAVIPVTLPEMTFAIIGSSTATGIVIPIEYTWNHTSRYTALTNGINFGPTGTVRITRFSQLWTTENVTTARDNLNNGFEGGQWPDVVLCFSHNITLGTDLTNALSNYINRGGCVIYGSADGAISTVNTLMNALFGMIDPATTQLIGISDDVYPVSYLPDSPVVNGPFGNLSGHYWGEDNDSYNSIIMMALPANSVQVCTARSAYKTGQDPGYSIVWYNESKNFLFFGDSTGASTSSTSNSAYPSLYSTTGLPRSKSYGPSSYTQYIYNSALELNAVAWAIRKAASAGINQH